MIGNWQSAEKPVHERFLELAESYRQAAMNFCHCMTRHESQRTWPNASVVLLLSAHSVELFLKGVILCRAPGTDFGPGHRLHELHGMYASLYSEPELAFEPFFRSEYPGFTESEAATLRSAEPVPSIQYRYPVQKSGAEWPGLHAFEPEQFFELLDALGEDYGRIAAHL